MMPLSVLTDNTSDMSALRAALGDAFKIRFLDVDQMKIVDPRDDVVVDIDVARSQARQRIKEWMAGRGGAAKTIFAVDRGCWHSRVQASAFGASAICDRPICGTALADLLLGEFGRLADSASDRSLRSEPAVALALDALESMFIFAQQRRPVDHEMIRSASSAILQSVSQHGVNAWLELVRCHHSQTYQHCLLVAGLSASFSQRLKFSETDQQRLTYAAMLHDIGKARIPIDLLEKPAKLDDAEMEVMRKHPEFGYAMILEEAGIEPLIQGMVLDHHEYLDGSGYPRGLKARRVCDLTRMITICDVFAALIERRPYKAAMSLPQAYQGLLDMGPKLDADLRREFRAIVGQGQH